jgi:uroporphyrinogen-III synthase
VVSDELRTHGLRASILPPEGAHFMKPLISAMAVELAKSPPKMAAR